MLVEDAPFTPYHGIRNRDTLNKKFIAWDGEGITPVGELRQNYVLFGNSEGYTVQSRRLTTVECLELILKTERAFPNALHVGFAFSYDVEMILADLSIKSLRTLRDKGRVYYRGYRIEYKKSKWFSVGKQKKDGTNKVFAKVWDVWGFFQSSFVAALRENIGEFPELKQIEEGKSGRAQFTYEDLDSGFMLQYMRLELKHTVAMMNDLRQRLYAADLRINHWHGPGAIASHAMGQRKIDTLYLNKEVPKRVNEAAQYAYAGGRFELFKVGHHDGPVYAYDIRSAYPSAMVDLPNMQTGTWIHNPNPDPKNLVPFGLYHIRFASKGLMSGKPMPFFYRDAKHRIHFPNVCEGWYWTPEASLAAMTGTDSVIVEGWEYIATDEKPMAWVYDMYQTRAEWKRAGNPSQMALKLLLNSLYGKFAQRVGWENFGAAPKWHQLEWAGFITSTARAKLFRAMLQAQGTNSLLGVETDGIFTTKPLNLDIGPDLGQWELSTYESMIYLQSGFYFKKEAGEWSAKYRGFDKGCITADQTIDLLANWKPWEGDKGLLEGTTTRFTTMGHYLFTKEPDANRNRWITGTRTLNIGGDGKRVHRHQFCRACQDKVSPAETTHSLTINNPIGGFSRPHSLPWLDHQPNPYHSLEEDGIRLDH